MWVNLWTQSKCTITRITWFTMTWVRINCARAIKYLSFALSQTKFPFGARACAFISRNWQNWNISYMQKFVDGGSLGLLTFSLWFPSATAFQIASRKIPLLFFYKLRWCGLRVRWRTENATMCKGIFELSLFFFFNFTFSPSVCAVFVFVLSPVDWAHLFSTSSTLSLFLIFPNQTVVRLIRSRNTELVASIVNWLSGTGQWKLIKQQRFAGAIKKTIEQFVCWQHKEQGVRLESTRAYQKY